MRLALLLLAGCSPALLPDAPRWPRGSKITPNICFQMETGGRWVPAQVRSKDGTLPAYGTAFGGEWYFQEGAKLRAVDCATHPI